MAFTYDTSTDIGKLRLYLGDTTEAEAVFSDEELAVFLSGTSNLFLAVARAYNAWAGLAVRTDYSYRLGDRSLDRKGVQRKLLDAARYWEQQAARDDGYPFDWPQLLQPVGDYGEQLPFADEEGV